MTIFEESVNKALKGGIAGSSAMIVQVSSLMWLRTTMNYQYRYGTSTIQTLKILYSDGGLLRFYRGYLPAITIGPLSRFGDTASNAYMMKYLEEKDMPIYIKTLFGSSTASLFRISLMPIDALKTTLQVEGKHGINLLKTRINNYGVRTLYNGSLASMSATFVGHYPWFLTYNLLNSKLPTFEDSTLKTLGRNAFIGFNASIISDCCSNSLRVIKTTKQTYKNDISYYNTIINIINKDGILGLMGRGLKTRIITNGLQGMIFNVCWKYFEKKLS